MAAMMITVYHAEKGEHGVRVIPQKELARWLAEGWQTDPPEDAVKPKPAAKKPASRKPRGTEES